MKTMGIDLGTYKTGYAILKNGEIEKSGTIHIKKGEQFERLLKIADVIESIIETSKPDRIFIERPFGRFRTGLFPLHALLGMLLRIGYKNNAVVELAHTTEIMQLWNLKNLKRGEKKQAVIKAVENHFNITVTDDNEADAISLAMLY